MKNEWDDVVATEMVEEMRRDGISKDVSLRVYTTRLLGCVPQLVLHGGGNTSVKSKTHDSIGREWDVIHVKGSGWDMGSIEPAGLPAVKLEPILCAADLDSLADEQMIELLRSNLIYSHSPNPSVETLLHAFIPMKYVDHTHSTAILSLVDQVDSKQICDELFGETFGFVPYVMPGFDLAKKAAGIYHDNPAVKGLILDKHGIFTFADSAKDSYDYMIDAVSIAESYIVDNRKSVSLPKAKLPKSISAIEEVLPIIRGCVAHNSGNDEFRRFICDFRSDSKIREFVDAVDMAKFSTRGMPTPDLAIRIKNKPIILPPAHDGNIEQYKSIIEDLVENYSLEYASYFEKNNAKDNVDRVMLDPRPRLALIPGLGLIGFGRTSKEATVAADVGEIFVEAVAGSQSIGEYTPVNMHELFKLEYWSLEQAKLASKRSRPLDGQIVFVTGAAGTIGQEICRVFSEQGAQLCVVDINGDAAKKVAASIGEGHLAIECDVTNCASVELAFSETTRRFGGVDIVVSNSGKAWQGAIGELSSMALRSSFELNFFAHQTISQQAIKIFKAQNTGGCLLYNISKQAINPGKNFGAYGIPKAATLFLSRQYALEYGSIGVRVNAVNADRIRSGLLTDEMIEQRSSERNLSTSDYMSGNLLKREVSARDVAYAFLFQALARSTTGNVVTVDGGNIAAILR